jgi:hypothetical protein
MGVQVRTKEKKRRRKPWQGFSCNSFPLAEHAPDTKITDLRRYFTAHRRHRKLSRRGLSPHERAQRTE